VKDTEIIAILNRIKKSIELYNCKTTKGLNIVQINIALGIYKQHNFALEKLIAKYSERFECFNKFTSASNFDILIHSVQLLIIQSNVECYLDILSSILTENASVTKEGIFFPCQSFDALMLVHRILSEAKQSITLIDGYIDENILALLSRKQSGVNVKILAYVNKGVPSNFKPLTESFNSQYGDLSIHLSDHQLDKFHDRFLFIDEIDFYHFGASIKDAAKKSAFMFSRIEEELIIDSLKSKFTEYWDKSTVFI